MWQLPKISRFVNLTQINTNYIIYLYSYYIKLNVWKIKSATTTVTAEDSGSLDDGKDCSHEIYVLKCWISAENCKRLNC